MYSSATDNKVYKQLDTEVEHIYINGELYKLESYAYGIGKPVGSADDFHELLLQWNESSTEGKFAPTDGTKILAHPPNHRVLLSEEPIEAIWLRLRQLQSVTLAIKSVRERAKEENIRLDNEAVHAKAEGIAFALRNSEDYFHASEAHNVSQRVLNLYYGSLAFAFAEILASPTGAKTLGEIEKITKQGHGLYMIDGDREGLEHLIVGAIGTGFFPFWMKSMGLPVDEFPMKKPRSFKDLWWDALPIHHSPFERNALILPFGVVGEYRSICIVLLYGLSIVVRYRPSVWRRVQEGDLNHMRVLIEAFLAVAERILPEQFLEKVTGRKVFAKQPGSLF